MTHSIQPHLLPLARRPADIQYTPPWVAADMVSFFKPSGAVMDPCRGGGEFYSLLGDGALWCEIVEGRDFFSFLGRVDWLIGNPPYSVFSEWMRHSMEAAAHICYLIPANKVFNSARMMREVNKWGGAVHMRLYGSGGTLGFSIGFAIAAVYFRQGYTGGMTFSDVGVAYE